MKVCWMSRLRTILLQVRTWGPKGIWDYLRRLRFNRRIARFMWNNARRHQGTRAQRGITVVAPMSGAYSLSKAMRDFVICLQKAQIPHQVFDCNTPDGNVAPSDYEKLKTPRSDFNVLKYSTTIEMLTSPLPSELSPHRARIAFWEGEHGVLKVFPYLADSDTVIAMSDFNASYYRRVMPQSVRVCKMLYPLPPVPKAVSSKKIVREKYGVGADDFVVFFNFDLFALYRKNPEGLMRAFAAALGQASKACLVFKVNQARKYPERVKDLEQLAVQLGIEKKFKMIEGYLPMEDIYGLTATADVYASLHRSEGFGLGIAEAMQYGIPVVVSAYSAPLEFCHVDNAMLIPCKMVPLEDKSFAETMREFAEPNEEVAAQALRRLFDDRTFAKNLGMRGKMFVEQHFSIENFRASVEAFLDMNKDQEA